MLKKKIEVIPAIDIIGGMCVRLQKGDFEQKTIYSIKPLEIARKFEDAGIKRLHIVDLNGAKSRSISSLSILEEIANNTKLKIDFGGGVRNYEDVMSIFNAGASFVTVGTLAVKNKSMWTEIIEKFGANNFLLGADVFDNKIKISGWLEDSNICLFDFLRSNIAMGIKNIFITDISKDGLMKGCAVELYKEVINLFPEINLIASGGIRDINDIEILDSISCYGVIIGKAIYENRVSIDDLKKYL